MIRPNTDQVEWIIRVASCQAEQHVDPKLDTPSCFSTQVSEINIGHPSRLNNIASADVTTLLALQLEINVCAPFFAIVSLPAKHLSQPNRLTDVSQWSDLFLDFLDVMQMSSFMRLFVGHLWCSREFLWGKYFLKICPRWQLPIRREMAFDRLVAGSRCPVVYFRPPTNRLSASSHWFSHLAANVIKSTLGWSASNQIPNQISGISQSDEICPPKIDF